MPLPPTPLDAPSDILPDTPPAEPAWPRRVALIAAATGTGFLLLVLALQFLRGDLAWADAQLSLYLHGPYGLLLRTAYCLLAVAIAGLALAVQASLPPSRRSRTTLLLFFGAGIGLVGVAVGDSYLPARAPLLAPLVHLMSAQMAFLCVIAAVLMQAWRFRGAPHWHRHHSLAWWLGWLAFIVLFAHAVLRLGPRGLGQKSAITLIVTWLVLVAWQLLRRPATGAAPATESRDNAGLVHREER